MVEEARPVQPGDGRRAGPGRWVRSAGRGAAAGAGAGARTGRRALRVVTHGRGAGESGLSRVLELHLVSTAADMLVITALAGTLFFSVPTEAARGRVATSLLVTMVPFVVLAPLIGPALDRVPHGRRYALAATAVVRAWLAWVMASAVVGGGEDAAFSLYPAAFGFLVCQKAYLVTRSSAVPRVLPDGADLVAANSRVSLSGVAGMIVAAPLGAGLTGWVGPEWTMRLAFLVFAGGTALALALPARVDSSEGEDTVREATTREGVANTRPMRRLSSTVVHALRGNTALRAFTGFLTIFLAFRLRTDPVGGLSPGTAVAVVLAVAGVGGGIGTALGGALHRLKPIALVTVSIGLVVAAATWAAIDYGLWPVLLVAGAAGLGQAMGKLALDALIQRDVAERVRTSAFARSETVLQLAWVVGGGVGLLLPLSGRWGLGVAALATAVAGLLIAWPGIRRRLP